MIDALQVKLQVTILTDYFSPHDIYQNIYLDNNLSASVRVN